MLLLSELDTLSPFSPTGGHGASYALLSTDSALSFPSSVVRLFRESFSFVVSQVSPNILYITFPNSVAQKNTPLQPILSITQPLSLLTHTNIHHARIQPPTSPPPPLRLLPRHRNYLPRQTHPFPRRRAPRDPRLCQRINGLRLPHNIVHATCRKPVPARFGAD
jgi:hypothetical protein